MNIAKTVNGAQVILALSGRLDTTTAPQLEEELKSCMASASELKLELSQLEYLSSAGLRVILSALKQMKAKGGAFAVMQPNDTVREIFEITGFSDLLTIE